MTIGDIENFTAPELKALSERAANLASERAAQDRDSFRKRVLNDIKEAGYTVADILGKPDKPAKAPKPKDRVRAINPNDKRHGPRTPRYRHPSGDRTWSGQGRQPKWIKELLDSGVSLHSLRIPA